MQEIDALVDTYKAKYKRKEGETEEHYEKRIRDRISGNETRRKKLLGQILYISAKKILKVPGYRVILETFTKWQTRVFTADINAHVRHIVTRKGNSEMLYELEREINKFIYNWVKSDDDYDNDYICVVDTGKYSSSYNGKTKTISVNLTLKQKRTTKFSDTYKMFESKFETIRSSLTTIIETYGLELIQFKGYNSSDYNG